MNNLLNSALTVLKSLPSKLYAAAPFPVGVAVGYLFHAPLKVALEATVAVVRGLLKV